MVVCISHRSIQSATLVDFQFAHRPEETGYDVPELARAANAAFAATGLDGSAFDTTYCDETLRISRGGNPLRGELRVFTRVAAPATPSPEVADEDRYMVAPDMEGDPEDSMPSD